MIKNYFKIAWRNLIKDRQFTFLNMIGLSTGLACSLLIYLWVIDELGVDKFNENDSRRYQIMRNLNQGSNGIQTFESNSYLLLPALVLAMPEIEYAVPVSVPFSDGILSVDMNKFKATGKFGGKEFFNVFPYRLTEGNKKDVLLDKNAIVISDELAVKVFGTRENIAGKTIKLDQEPYTGIYTISGVFEKSKHNSSEQFDFLLSYELFVEKKDPNLINWDSNGILAYLMLNKGVDADKFNIKINNFYRSKLEPLYGTDHPDWIGTMFIRCYSDKYLYNKYENGVQAGGRIEHVRLFSIIAIFILVIACINFMNLSTAKASRRLKEVGIKKVVGAGRHTLIFQYLGESMLMTFLSLVIALLLIVILLPQFNSITGKQLAFNFDANIIISVLTITFFTGLIAGSYPAFYLSGFKPVAVLKGKFHTSFSELWIRKGLVVFQFMLSVIFIISTLIVYKQMTLIKTINLGYNKDNIITFKKEGRLKEGLQTFVAEIKKIPEVENASSFDRDLIGNHGGTGAVVWKGKNPNEKIQFAQLEVDYNLMETMGMQMAEGRAFSEKYNSDSSKIIFNQAAIDAMGLKNPVDKIVKLWGKEYQIIGVVKNFNFESLYEKVKPCFLQCKQDGSNILVKIKTDREKEAIAHITKLYKEYNHELPFDYRFLDNDYQALYSSEQRIAILSRYFSGITILISCLGLFGLATFTAQRKQKEIGIRKVVGASVSNVAVMLSVDFFKLVLIALLIAVPLSWWAANQWLQSFAYRINIDGSVFLITSVSVILITLSTIGFQTIKAAVANPVKSLRTE